MLLSFSISNFRSIKERQTFSMLADAGLKERYNDVFALKQYKGLGVLKTSVLYGKNNAGKSNALKAFKALQWLLRSSNNFAEGAEIKANEFFLFDKQYLNRQTFFEIDFIAENEVRYVYHVAFDKKEVFAESLSFYKKDTAVLKPVNLFKKESPQNYIFQNSYKGPQKEVVNLTANNQLFLSKAATNHPNEHVANAYRFITQNTKVFSFDSDFEDKVFTKHTRDILLRHPEYVGHIAEFMKALDTDILGIKIQERDMENLVLPNNIPDEIREQLKAKLIEDLKYSIEALHRMFDGEAETDAQAFPLTLESTGTQKLFSLLSIMIDAFYNGHLLLIDELDKSLNPYWTKYLIQTFYDERFNKNNAQLVFVSHDAVQIQDFLFAKDQINIVEKDYYGKTEINNLADFRGIRKEIPLDKWYLSGRLGGVPVIRGEKFINFEIGKKNGQEQGRL